MEPLEIFSYPYPSRVDESVVDNLLSKSEKHEYHGEKSLIIEYKLPNGFTISGSADCVEGENFNHGIGCKTAYADAKKKLWYLLGFHLQQLRYQD